MVPPDQPWLPRSVAGETGLRTASVRSTPYTGSSSLMRQTVQRDQASEAPRRRRRRGRAAPLEVGKVAANVGRDHRAQRVLPFGGHSHGETCRSAAGWSVTPPQ